MRNLILLTIAIFVLTSCSKTFYQISEMESNEKKTNNDQYYFENNEIKISYSFWADGGNFSLLIENKTSNPIFIDWQHSNFIFNNKSFDYYEGKTSSFGSKSSIYTDPLIYLPKVVLLEDGHYSTEQFNEKASTQLPPKSVISPRLVNLNFPYKFNLKKGQNVTFSENETPMKIRAYIGYSTSKELKELKYIDNSFWLKQITNKSINEKGLNKSNKFYIKYQSLYH